MPLGLIAVALMAGGFGFGEIGGVEVKVRGVACGYGFEDLGGEFGAGGGHGAA
jgi:hypothetical protein